MPQAKAQSYLILGCFLGAFAALREEISARFGGLGESSLPFGNSRGRCSTFNSRSERRWDYRR